MSHRKRKTDVTPELAEAIKRLHHEHQELGHDGIGKLLADEGFEIDSHDLRLYMDEHHLDAGPTATFQPHTRIWPLGGN